MSRIYELSLFVGPWWRGPGRVLEVCSPHSYIVELNRARQHVHANRLKQFIVSSDCVIMQPDFETACGGCDDSAAVCDVCVTNINSTSDDDL